MAVTDTDTLQRLVAIYRDLPKAEKQAESLRAKLADVKSKARASIKSWQDKERAALEARNTADSVLKRHYKAKRRIMAEFVPLDLRTAKDRATSAANKLRRTLADETAKLAFARRELEKASNPSKISRGGKVQKVKARISKQEAAAWLAQIEGDEGDLALLRQDLAKAEAVEAAASKAVDVAFEEAVARGQA